MQATDHARGLPSWWTNQGKKRLACAASDDLHGAGGPAPLESATRSRRSRSWNRLFAMVRVVAIVPSTRARNCGSFLVRCTSLSTALDIVESSRQGPVVRHQELVAQHAAMGGVRVIVIRKATPSSHAAVETSSIGM